MLGIICLKGLGKMKQFEIVCESCGYSGSAELQDDISVLLQSCPEQWLCPIANTCKEFYFCPFGRYTPRMPELQCPKCGTDNIVKIVLGKNSDHP